VIPATHKRLGVGHPFSVGNFPLRCLRVRIVPFISIPSGARSLHDCHDILNEKSPVGIFYIQNVFPVHYGELAMRQIGAIEFNIKNKILAVDKTAVGIVECLDCGSLTIFLND